MSAFLYMYILFIFDCYRCATFDHLTNRLAYFPTVPVNFDPRP